MGARTIHGDGRGVRPAAWALAAAVVLSSALPGTAGAAQRVALVIGNAAYEHISELRNPGNDAADMAAALGRLGFEVVEGTNLDFDGFYDKLGEFDEAAREADVTLFFYSGQGLEVEGKNWLVATDARLEKKLDLRRGAIELDTVLESMRGTKKLVFLDTNRNNPLPEDWARSSMGPPSWTASGSGMLVVYATAPGGVASDGAGRNSPFTAALLAHIERPGLSVVGMFSEVAASVREATNGDQQPWMSSSLMEPIYLASEARRKRVGPPGTKFRDCPAAPARTAAQNPAAPFTAAVSLAGSSPLRLGDPVSFVLSAGTAGYGHLYILNTSGSVVALAENLAIAPDAPVPFPAPDAGFTIHARPPVGADRVLLLVTRQPFQGLGGEGAPVTLAVRTDAFVAQLNAATARLAAHGWALAETRVEVVAAGG